MADEVRPWWVEVNRQIPPGTLRLLSLVYTNVVLGVITFAGGLGLHLSTGWQITVWAAGALLSTLGVWRAEVNKAGVAATTPAERPAPPIDRSPVA